jgi:hypothetical protein
MDNLIEQILGQCPENTTKSDVDSLIKKHNSNVVNILTEVWEIKEQQKQKQENKHDWEKIREICNSYEEEMENFMNTKKT